MVSQMVPYLPCYDGFRVIPAQLLRVLSKAHEIHLVAFTTGQETCDQRAWATAYCRSTHYLSANARGLLSQALPGQSPFSPAAVDAVRSRLRVVNPDVLHIEGPTLAALGPLTDFRGATVLSAHDALSLRYAEFARFSASRRSWFHNHVYARLARRMERRWYPRVDRVIVTSVPDARALTHCLAPSRLNVVPNGVDLDHLEYRGTGPMGRLVFTGNMSWPPNVDAARHFATNILPAIRAQVPNVEFWIVGADPAPAVRALAALPGVHVTGTVPDIRPLIWSGSVYVSPLRFGAGVKNKILEAMALGAPIVATPTSITGTPLVHGRHLLIAEASSGMASAVLSLLRHDDLRRQLAKEARLEVELNHTWDSVAQRVERVWQGVCETTAREAHAL